LRIFKVTSSDFSSPSLNSMNTFSYKDRLQILATLPSSGASQPYKHIPYYTAYKGAESTFVFARWCTLQKWSDILMANIGHVIVL